MQEYKKTIDVISSKEVIGFRNSYIRGCKTSKVPNVFASKIDFMAITKVRENPTISIFETESGNPYDVMSVFITTNEFISIMDKSYMRGSDYRARDEALNYLKAAEVIILEDGVARIIPQYQEIRLTRGGIELFFNPEAYKFICRPSKKFTRLSLSTVLNLKKKSSIELYSLLRSFLYQTKFPDLSKEQNEMETVSVEFGVYEFYAMIREVEIKELALERIAKSQNIVKLELKANDIKGSTVIKSWADFKTKRLAPMIEEINEKSEIYIRGVEDIKEGRMVTRIRFSIQYNKNYLLKHPELAKILNDKKANEKEKEDLVDSVLELLGDYKTLTREDAACLLEESGNNIKDIQAIIDYAKKQDSIENLMAYLRRGLKERYWETKSVKVVQGSEELYEAKEKRTERVKMLNEEVDQYEESIGRTLSPLERGVKAREIYRKNFAEDKQRKEESESKMELAWDFIQESPDFRKFMNFCEEIGVFSALNEMNTEIKVEYYKRFKKVNDNTDAKKLA